MRRVMSLATDVRGPIAAVTACRVAAIATVIVQGFVMADVLEQVLDGAPLADQAGRFAAIGSVVLIRFVLVLAAGRLADATSAATKRALRARAFAKLVELGPGHIATRRTGDLKGVLVEDIESLERY